MAIKYGFYNSISGDRKYNAEDFGRIFDGDIRDGVLNQSMINFKLQFFPVCLYLSEGQSMVNNTWLENDANYPVSFPQKAEVLLNRIDAVVMEFNSTEGR